MMRTIETNTGNEWKLTIQRDSSFAVDSVMSCDGKAPKKADSGKFRRGVLSKSLKRPAGKLWKAKKHPK